MKINKKNKILQKHKDLINKVSVIQDLPVLSKSAKKKNKKKSKKLAAILKNKQPMTMLQDMSKINLPSDSANKHKLGIKAKISLNTPLNDNNSKKQKKIKKLLTPHSVNSKVLDEWSLGKDSDADTSSEVKDVTISNESDLHESEDDRDGDFEEIPKFKTVKTTSKLDSSSNKFLSISHTSANITLEDTSLSKGEKINQKAHGNAKDHPRKPNKFVLSDKAVILAEVIRRSREFESRCLHVAPIKGDCTFEQLKLLSPKLMCCRFGFNRKNSKPRSYVFLEYSDKETAKTECERLSGCLFGGNSLRVSPMTPSRSEANVTDPELLDLSKLFVSGLMPGVTSSELSTVFPTAQGIAMASTKTTYNHGFAILSFVNDALALDAFSTGHGFLLKGNPLFVNFKFKQPNSDPPKSKVVCLTTPKPSFPESSPGANEKRNKVIIHCESDSQAMDESNDGQDENSRGVNKCESEISEQSNLNEVDESAEAQSSEEDEDETSVESISSEIDSDDVELIEEVHSDETLSEDTVSGEEAKLCDTPESEEDTDSNLRAALKSIRANTKTLKNPGSKRNWGAWKEKQTPLTSASTTVVQDQDTAQQMARKRPYPMPTLLPVSSKKKMKKGLK